MVPRVLVVIPFIGKPEFVKSCLDSVLNSKIHDFDLTITLLDDGSSSEDLDKLRNLGVPDAFIVRNSKNIGYTRSVYNIVEYSKLNNFNYLLLCNSDVSILQHSIQTLVERMISNSNISVVGCKVLDWNSDHIIHTGTRINRNCENWIENPYCGLRVDDKHTKFVERRLWVNGCCALYNIDILKKENLNFSLEFSPAYFEESDLCTELNLRKYSVIYDPSAVVRHFVNATVRDYPEYNKIFSDNWNKYLSKWQKYFNSPILNF